MQLLTTATSQNYQEIFYKLAPFKQPELDKIYQFWIENREYFTSKAACLEKGYYKDKITFAPYILKVWKYTAVIYLGPKMPYYVGFRLDKPENVWLEKSKVRLNKQLDPFIRKLPLSFLELKKIIPTTKNSYYLYHDPTTESLNQSVKDLSIIQKIHLFIDTTKALRDLKKLSLSFPCTLYDNFFYSGGKGYFGSISHLEFDDGQDSIEQLNCRILRFWLKLLYPNLVYIDLNIAIKVQIPEEDKKKYPDLFELMKKMLDSDLSLQAILENLTRILTSNYKLFVRPLSLTDLRIKKIWNTHKIDLVNCACTSSSGYIEEKFNEITSFYVTDAGLCIWRKNEIDRGKYKIVFDALVLNDRDQLQRAVLSEMKIKKDSVDHDILKNEMKNQNTLFKQEGIVTLIDQLYIVENDSICLSILAEKCDKNLQVCMEQNLLPLWMREKIAIELLRGIKSIHDKNIVICDFKPPNVLIKFLTHRKVQVLHTDFGASFNEIEYDDRAETVFVTSLFYSSPEGIRRFFDSMQILPKRSHDIWSVGISLIELIYEIRINDVIIGKMCDAFAIKQAALRAAKEDNTLDIKSYNECKKLNRAKFCESLNELIVEWIHHIKDFIESLPYHPFLPCIKKMLNEEESQRPNIHTIFEELNAAKKS